MSKIIKIETIAQIHAILSDSKPAHPLITLIEPAKMKKLIMPVMDYRIVSGLYAISLKNGKECRIRYGRQPYDFQEGSLMFIAPDQTILPVEVPDYSGRNGWVLLFHPDLIRKSVLAAKMHEYTFFNYEAHEALHLSETERHIATNIVKSIEQEYSRNPDNFSHELIISHIGMLLNYGKRFYSRQFITRSTVYKDVVIRFERLLKDYFNSGQAEKSGLPDVKWCARQMGYSPNYFSDLLKKETGKNTEDHIHFHLIEKAKDLLLGSETPIQQIACSLGFEYPQHFSNLFKSKTGQSPAAFRN